MSNTWNLEVAGTVLTLFPERAAFWSETRTALVADVHLGKDATFRAEGVSIPLGSTTSDLERLSALIERTGAERLIVLGDLYHAAAGMTEQTERALRAWRSRHRTLEVVLVRGNHDRSAGRSPQGSDIAEHEDVIVDGPFAFRHVPKAVEGQYVIAGHVHPGVRVYGDAGQRERLPCFHATPSCLVLPAWSEFTGTHSVRPGPDDEVAVVAGDAVVPLSNELVRPT